MKYIFKTWSYENFLNKGQHWNVANYILIELRAKIKRDFTVWVKS